MPPKVFASSSTHSRYSSAPWPLKTFEAFLAIAT